MSLIYNIGMYLFAAGVWVAGRFNAKARLFAKGRKNQFTHLQDSLKGDGSLAWFHCASLGEFEQGRPVMEAYKKMHPEHRILLTFFSPSGYEVRKNYEGVDYVFYLPIDTRRNARRFMTIVKPTVAIFIKYEFWYHYLLMLKQQNVPTYIVSAIFRPSQIFFKWYGGFFRTMLKAYRCLFVQEENSVQLLKSIGVEQVVLAGDTRFDRVWAHTRQPATLPVVAAFTNGHPTLVAGSSWPSDEERLAKAMEILPENVRLIIAPHEVHEEHLASIEKVFEKWGTVRYTKLSGEKVQGTEYKANTLHPSPFTLHRCRVLIIDTIGLLMSVYSYGSVAYVGGGFDAGNGVHNTIEPAAYGLPVVFGPVYEDYAEAVGLVSSGGGVSVTNTEGLIEILQSLLLNEAERQRIGQISANYVGRNQGATDKVMEWL